jgi:hypothetical protein
MALKLCSRWAVSSQIPTTTAPASSAAKPKMAAFASSLVPPRLSRVAIATTTSAQMTVLVVEGSKPSISAKNGPAP